MPSRSRSGSSRSARRSAGRPTAPSRTAPRRFAVVARLRRELRAGDFDVVHLHEPVAPMIGWNGAHVHRRAARRHLPLLLRERPAAQGRGAAGRPPQAQPPHAPDRGLRGRGLDRPALLRRRVHRSSPTASRCPRRGVPVPRLRLPGAAARDRLRRPGRRAQGPADPAARLRGAARARGRAAHDRGRERARGRAAAGRARRHHGARAASRTSASASRSSPRTCWPRRRWAASPSAWS